MIMEKFYEPVLELLLPIGVCAQNFTEKILQIRKFRLPSPYKSMFLSFFLWINNLSTL